MNVLFVIPSFIKVENEYYEMPLGILYIATVLKENNHNVKIIDMNKYTEDDKVLEEYLADNTVDVVCTGGLSAFFFSIENIINQVKALDEKIVTVLGGGIVTSDRDLICSALDPDIAILGEGELTAIELMNALEKRLDLKDINGIAFKENSKWVYNVSKPTVNIPIQNPLANITYAKKDNWVFTDPRSSIDDIDTLPYPDFSLIDVEDYFSRQTPISSNYLYPLDYPRALPIITSRSCPLNCTFCFHPIGQKYRKKSMDKVFDEIEDMIEKYNMNILVVMDEMMSASPNRLIEFSNRIKKYNILWTCQLWTSSVDRKTLLLMKESGCYLISYGLESISQTVLDSMQKIGINKKNIESSLLATKDAGITIQGNFIFGDPAETVETSEETLSWWKKYPEYQISLGNVSPYPGTPLYRYAIAKGIITDKLKFIKDGTPALNMTNMSAVEYTQLKSKVAKYSSEVRQYCEIKSIKIDESSTRKSYVCDFKCPHCKKVVTYKNIFVSQPEIFKLGCRNCALRFDVNPSVFPNLKNKLEVQRKKILELHSKYGSIVVTPCVIENIFIEYFDFLGINYHDLNIKYMLDSNDTRVGSSYLDKYTIVKRDDKHIDDWGRGVVIVMPSFYRTDIVNELKHIGLADEQIFAVELE